MASYRADTISQLMGHGFWVRVLCRCGNNATISPEALIARGKAKLSDTIEQVAAKMRCKLCRTRPHDVFAAFPPESK